MNSRERFFNVLQGKGTDRRPFGAILSLYGAKLTGCPLKRYYNDASAYALGQDAICHEIEPDFLVGPFMLAGYGEAFGSTLHYTERYVPNLLWPAIPLAKEIDNIKVPDIDGHPRLLFMRDSIRMMAEAHGNEVVIVGIVLSPIDLPLVIMGIEGWLLTVLTDKDGTRRMLDITTPFFIDLCNKLFADGADVLAMPMPFFTKDITTGRLVSDFAVPSLTDVLRHIKGPVVFHHTGSSFFEYLELLDELPGAAGLTMDVSDSIPVARNRVRKETILFGGLDGPSLHTLSNETVYSRCLELLTESKDDSRFIPFASGTDVELQTPLDNLVGMRKAVEEYGNG